LATRRTTRRRATNLVTKTELARRLGVTKGCITQAVRPGGKIHAALVGKMVDVDHESVRRWFLSRDAAAAMNAVVHKHHSDNVLLTTAPHMAAASKTSRSPSEPPTARTNPKPSMPSEDRTDTPSEPPPDQSASEIEAELGPWREQVDLADLEEPLKTLTEKYGEARDFGNWVQQRKNLAAARKEEMQQARVAGRLIARTTVQNMISHIDVAFRLLLTDAPRKIATQVAPQDMPRTAALIRDTMGQMLDAAKAHLIQSLQNDDPLANLLEAAE
jgi:hypothetical protein